MNKFEHDKVVTLILHAHAQLREWIVSHLNKEYSSDEELEVSMQIDRLVRQSLVKDYELNLDHLYGEAEQIYQEMREVQLQKLADKKLKEAEHDSLIEQVKNMLDTK